MVFDSVAWKAALMAALRDVCWAEYWELQLAGMLAEYWALQTAGATVSYLAARKVSQMAVMMGGWMVDWMDG